MASHQASSPRPHPILSPSSTPTSSVRPSLDISRSNNSGRATSPVPSTNARRNRAALRDYYNLKTSNGARPPSRTGSIASTSTVAATPLTDGRASTDVEDQALSTLDDPSFSPDEYVQKLLRTFSLGKVLRAENLLVSEIKTLDGDRKALVYDNYSKLIRATETIGGLMGRMDNKDTSVQAGLGGESLLGAARTSAPNTTGIHALGILGPAVARVADTAKSLVGDVDSIGRSNSRNSRRRKQEVQSVKRVIQAPETLRKLLGNGERAEAETRWREVKVLLDKWSAVKGTKEIKESCENLLASDAL